MQCVHVGPVLGPHTCTHYFLPDRCQLGHEFLSVVGLLHSIFVQTALCEASIEHKMAPAVVHGIPDAGCGTH